MVIGDIDSFPSHMYFGGRKYFKEFLLCTPIMRLLKVTLYMMFAYYLEP